MAIHFILSTNFHERCTDMTHIDLKREFALMFKAMARACSRYITLDRKSQSVAQSNSTNHIGNGGFVWLSKIGVTWHKCLDLMPWSDPLPRSACETPCSPVKTVLLTHVRSKLQYSSLYMCGFNIHCWPIRLLNLWVFKCCNGSDLILGY